VKRDQAMADVLRELQDVRDQLAAEKAARAGIVAAYEVDRLAFLEAVGLRDEFEKYGRDTLGWVANALVTTRQDLDIARRTLAALREPSEAVLMAAKLGMEESWPLRQVAIPADWYARALEDAIAAAEEAVNPNPHRLLDKEEG
jgi:hypothetical protein